MPLHLRHSLVQRTQVDLRRASQTPAMTSLFTPRPSLPRPDTAARRQAALVSERKRFDYRNSDAFPAVVTNASPVPRPELPDLRWVLSAARIAVKSRLRLAGADRRLGMLNGSDAPAGAGASGDGSLGTKFKGLAESAGLFARAAFKMIIASEGGDGALDSELQKERAKEMAVSKRNTEMFAKLKKDGKGLIGDFVEGVAEPVEIHATKDYRALIGFESLSEVERAYFEHFDSDQTFARARVAGLNPMNIRAVMPEDVQGVGWMPTDDDLQKTATAFTGDNLQQAMSDDRLYMVDFPWLEDAPEAHDGSRFVFIPKALFAIPADPAARAQTPLVPVAIWIYRKGTPAVEAYKYTPRDGFSWQIAKLIVNVMDGNDHEYFRHLASTHLLMEPIGIALKRQLHKTHPVYRLLQPHFKGTIFINNLAVNNLLAPGGDVDKVLLSPVTQLAPLLSSKVASLKFNETFLESDLQKRSVMSDKLDFPYRDYALLLQSAIRTWAKDFIDEHYKDDKTVAGDTELQAWARELVGERVGLRGFGDESYLRGDSKTIISTKSYLTQVVTHVVFTSSCQHSALNFAQKPFLAYSVSWPLSTRKPDLPPLTQEGDSKGATWEDWREWFPGVEDTQAQWTLLQLLGGVKHTSLGKYPRNVTKGSAKLKRSLRNFQAELTKIGAVVEKGESNARVPYLVLHPRQIPASINI